ncbi:MAG: hypothetical protein Kow00124_17470 [Anaerolineae bacterium]
MTENSAVQTNTPWRSVLEQVVSTEARGMALARRGRVTATLLLVLAGLDLLLMVGHLTLNPSAAGQAFPDLGFLTMIGLLVLLVPVFWVNRRGYVMQAGLLLALLLLALTLAFLHFSGLESLASLFLLVVVLMAGLLGPPASAFLVGALAFGGYVLLNLINDPAFMRPFDAYVAVLGANLLLVAVISWLFSRTVNRALQESEEYSTALTVQRAEIERSLLLQTRQLQATVAVAHAVAGTRDLGKLLADAVELVRESFGYYHVQVFLIDDDGQYAVLQQSTGEVGQKLLARGHRLPVGSLSVIGQVTAAGKPVLARNTDVDAVHRRNELLPNTRSELAIPLRIGDNRIIGALDLQSTEPDAFSEEVMPTLQALADQIAMAIENARLFEQTQDSLRELSELNREAAQRSWSDFLSEVRQEERRQVVGPETNALAVHRSRVAERVLSSGSIIISTGKDGELAFMAAPIVVRNEVVGVLGVEPDGLREWTQDDLQLLQGIAERTALAVENARLYLQAQRAAERERMINTIASRLQRAPSLAILLESAARELAEALGTDNVYAELSIDRPLTRTRRQVTSTEIEPVGAEADEREGRIDVSESPLEAASDETEEAKAEL